MADFAPFDRRHYPTLPVREGYSAWAETYEDTVLDLMDLRLLERLTAVDWAHAGRVLDLACGTGRGGAWLKSRGALVIDGLDLTPAMLRLAEAKGIYDRLSEGDVTATGLAGGAYGLIIMLLADEHLADLAPVYSEAARLAASGARFVLVGYHPWFLMSGVPTHFNDASGRPLAIQSHVHLFADHVRAAHGARWRLVELEEGVVDAAWIAAKPKWADRDGRPVSFAFVWEKVA